MPDAKTPWLPLWEGERETCKCPFPVQNDSEKIGVYTNSNFFYNGLPTCGRVMSEGVGMCRSRHSPF